MIYVPKFPELLKGVRCPVLAIFGEKDSNVDWRKTEILYGATIGKGPNADLTIKTFPDGNHNIQKCETGGFREIMKLGGKGPPCDGYYETMMSWVHEHGFDR